MSPINERPRFAVKSKSAAGSPDMILIGRLILAAVLLILGAFVIKNQVVRVILLVLSAIASAFDLGLKAFDSVLEKDYFASPILVLFIAFVSFLIGYPTEGAAMLLLYQLSILVVEYARKRTRSAALELLNGENDEILDQAGEMFAADDAGKLQMEADAFRGADLLLKIAMAIAVVYIFLLPRLGDYTYSVAIHRALMIMMTAIPASVIVAMPYTALVGLCYGARNGILFRNGKVMEKTADTNVAVFDKAGIFASGAPELQSVHSDVLDRKTFMSFVAHAVYYSEQGFAKAIPALSEQDYKLEVISDFVDVPGCGVEVKIGGSPVILATDDYLTARGVAVPEVEEEGEVFYLTVSGRYVGYLVFASQTNDIGLELLEGVRDLGVRETVLLTEDGAGESQKFADKLGFDEVFGECDTERKLQHIEDLNQGTRNHVMFLYSNGLEMHSAADVDVRFSQKTKFADVAIPPEKASALPFAMQLSRRMCQVAKENAIFVFAVKALMIFLSMLGLSSIWFVLFMDSAAVLATLLNAIRVTKDPLIDMSRFAAPKDEF